MKIGERYRYLIERWDIIIEVIDLSNIFRYKIIQTNNNLYPIGKKVGWRGCKIGYDLFHLKNQDKLNE